MSQALRKLTANIKRTNTLVIFINQIRMKIGVMFGNPETTTGGNALKFYASVRMDIRRIGSIKKGDEVIGSETRVKVVKNKVAPPFRQAEFDIMYGKGISREGSLLDMAVDLGIVKKSGAWFTYEGEQLGQGRENAKSFLVENPEIMVEISEKVMVAAGLRQAEGSGDTFTPADDQPIEIE
jgi:recombination protein RecA